MDKIKAVSNAKPYVHVPLSGPTVTLYRSDLTEETVTDEKGRTYTQYTYTEYRFMPGEYEQLRQGMKPNGAEWDADLRRIERSFLYDQADVMLAKADDYPSDPTWTAYAEQVREYKRGVRETVNQPNYPIDVTYPTIPEQPN